MNWICFANSNTALFVRFVNKNYDSLWIQKNQTMPCANEKFHDQILHHANSQVSSTLIRIYHIWADFHKYRTKFSFCLMQNLMSNILMCSRHRLIFLNPQTMMFQDCKMIKRKMHSSWQTQQKWHFPKNVLLKIRSFMTFYLKESDFFFQIWFKENDIFQKMYCWKYGR